MNGRLKGTFRTASLSPAFSTTDRTVVVQNGKYLRVFDIEVFGKRIRQDRGGAWVAAPIPRPERPSGQPTRRPQRIEHDQPSRRNQHSRDFSHDLWKVPIREVMGDSNHEGGIEAPRYKWERGAIPHQHDGLGPLFLQALQFLAFEVEADVA